jgi:hypothetical protein
MGLSTTLTCATCHSGSQPNEGGANQPHYNGANRGPNGTAAGKGYGNVTISATFKAQTGTLGTTGSLSAFTCNAVSCHGGQTTPGWQIGKLAATPNGNTECRACHKVASTATQYNDATGTHTQNGTHSGAACNVCHDMTTANTSQGVTNHWKYLDTTAVIVSPDQLSSQTIKFIGGSITDAGGSYTASGTIGNGNCTVNCHSGGGKNHNPEAWRK